MSDEVLRKLEREVATEGSEGSRIRLASELERRGRADEATSVLFEALAAHPASEDVRRALGRFRGPSMTEWSLPHGDARNTRRSLAKGPKGEGKLIERRALAPFASAQFTRTQDTRIDEPDPVPPPLVVKNYVYSALATGRQVLAATSDGHVVMENSGAGGFEWSANRDAVAAWKIFMPVQSDDEGRPEFWSEPHAVIAPDATVYGVTSLRRLIAIEPTGAKRFEQDLPAKITGLALDAARGRLHVLYENPAGLSTRDLATGREVSWASLAPIVVAHNTIVCDDGRVACVSAFGSVGIVNLAGELERTIKFAEKIGGAEGALTPWGELVVVSFDPTGAAVSIFDPGSGANRGHFNAPDCRGAPAVDAAGTIYLDGGAHCVMGYDLVTHQPKYSMDRPSYWREARQPVNQLALREGELAFIEVTREGVMFVRVGA